VSEIFSEQQVPTADISLIKVENDTVPLPEVKTEIDVVTTEQGNSYRTCFYNPVKFIWGGI